MQYQSDSNNNAIQKAFELVMGNYGRAKARNDRSETGFAVLDRTLRTSEPVRARGHNLVPKWSVGVGNFASVPWYSFLDRRETSSTQQGVYVVYLFCEDMSGVYLTFNQGVTEYNRQYGRREARRMMRARAEELRPLSEHLPSCGFSLDNEIDLRSSAGLAQDYEATTIAHKLYERGSVPADAELLHDLEQVLKVYDSYLSGEHNQTPIDPPRDESTTPPTPQPPHMLDLLKRQFAAASLHYSDWQIATFYTALQSKGFVILSGISGTGKTKLIQQFASLFPEPPSPPGLPLSGEYDELAELRGSQHNWLFLPVRPDWRDSKSLLGYHNPLTNRYEWTPFLRFILRAAADFERREATAWFIILDEMNLAHVEYYFADLLSVLESGRDGHGWTREHLEFISSGDDRADQPPSNLALPPNLYIVGTVNIDETTHAFSPKVLDRAFSLELSDVDFARYPPSVHTATDISVEERQWLLDSFSRGRKFTHIDKAQIAAFVTAHPDSRDWLQALNEQLRPFNFHFGYRVFDEIVTFLAAAEQNGLFDSLGDGAAFDAAALMKVLPKFHGSRGRLEAPLKAILAWCLDPSNPSTDGIATASQAAASLDDPTMAYAALDHRFRATAKRVIRMLRELYIDGFTAFG